MRPTLTPTVTPTERLERFQASNTETMRMGSEIWIGADKAAAAEALLRKIALESGWYEDADDEGMFRADPGDVMVWMHRLDDGRLWVEEVEAEDVISELGVWDPETGKGWA